MYERFRNDFINALSNIENPIAALDSIALNYEFASRIISIDTEHDTIIDIYARDMAMQGKSKYTISQYTLCLENLHRYLNRPLVTASKDDLKSFIYWYQYTRREQHGKQPISDVTADNIVHYIKSFYSWASDEDYVKQNPAHTLKKIKYSKKIKSPIDEVSMETLRRMDMTLRDKTIIEVAYSTGCRINELRTMKRSDVDFNNRIVKVLGKGNVERLVPLNVSAMLCLKDYFSTRSDDVDFVFVSERKPYRQLTRLGMNNIFTRLKEKSGIDGFSCHKIRHTTACVMLNKGADVSVVQQVLGHRSINTTMIYAQNTQERIKNEHWRCIV